MAELAAKVCDALSDDALKIAMGIGTDRLAQHDGLVLLIERIKAHVYDFKEEEARELCQAGLAPDGPLARQTGERMSSYITRRTRWFERLRQLDGDTNVSGHILADYLWSCASIWGDR